LQNQNQHPRRAKANLHPGLPDVKVTKPRRSSAQVAADKAAALTEKSAKEQSLATLRKAAIKKIAAKEDQMVIDDAQQKDKAARPLVEKIVNNVAKRLPPGVGRKLVNKDQQISEKSDTEDEDAPFYGGDGVLDSNEESQILIYHDKKGRFPLKNTRPIFAQEEEDEEEEEGGDALMSTLSISNSMSQI
jgi:hypothetical protein